jgi:hopanoid biosynthesis associated RND transporter like protein HpnN
MSVKRVSANLIVAPVRFAARRPILVLLLAVLLGVGCVWLAAARLAVTTDVDDLFAATLPWKQREAELRRLFPQFTDLLVAVVEADSPEAADATAAGLQAALLADPHFRSARRPDAAPFFDRNGLLFLDREPLEKLLNQTIDAQPFLGQLAADPSARGLFAALSLVGMGVERGQADLAAFAAPLQGFDAALRSAMSGDPKPLSWQRLLAGPVADMGGPYRFVLAQTHLDYGALQPGAAATDAMRAAIAGLEFVRNGQAHVRITGAVALSDEEFATVAQGAAAGLIGSTVVVIVWLAFAVRTWRLIIPILLTLMLGLLFTTGFGTLTSSPLNLISVAFAILFVGIAVDFSIQFSVRYREMAAGSHDAHAALEAAARRAGPQILVAAAATSAGFLAFVPTDFLGVAELGVIAGAGMLIAFACTVTVLPAAIVLFQGHGAPMATEAGFAWAAPLDRFVVRARWGVVGGFAILGVLGLAALPYLSFDSDPLHTKNPDTEAMRTLSDLAANPLTDPYSIDILAPDAAAARAVIDRVQGLPLVAQVISLDSFVPADQAPKLALIADAASLLSATLAPRAPMAPATAVDLRMAAAATGAQLARAVSRLPPGHPLTAIAATIKQLESAPDAVLLAANAALTRFLPLQLDRLRLVLQAGPVTLADIPPDIARDWALPDGRRRVQVSGKLENAGNEGLRRFVDQVRGAAPEAGGSAVTIVETANTIIRAFTHAALGALAAIIVILALALRRPVDVLMVLAPLLLSGLLTVLAAVLLPLPLNFANIIALPLLLGVGVSFNIYFVMNWRYGLREPLVSPTARAVVFSALTTGTAFGSLALSAHPGTASMGRLLLLSLGCTLLASLLFVPALLAIIPPQLGVKDGAARR